MAAKLSGDDEPISEINIVPFVDIILVVLIIFMVTTPLIIKPSININLPKAVTGEETTPSQINVGVTKDGELLLNGKQSTEDEISSYAKDLIAKRPDVQAIVSADKDVSHGSVIHIIDIIKSTGITKFAITIDKQAGK